MPVMDGLQATRLIRSYEKTGNWDEARLAGVELSGDHIPKEQRRRIPIIAVSTLSKITYLPLLCKFCQHLFSVFVLLI